jgi:hypothetical protein
MIGSYMVATTQSETQPYILTRWNHWRTRQDSNLWPLPSEGSALSS